MYFVKDLHTHVRTNKHQLQKEIAITKNTTQNLY